MPEVRKAIFMNRRKPQTFDEWNWLLECSAHSCVRSSEIYEHAKREKMPRWFICHVGKTFFQRVRRHRRIRARINNASEKLIDALFGSDRS